ncbi:hypothetical protein DBW_1970 [Desulfuromonas sp. DDH964]|uniref:LEA type 2 family protein n=1 Tax=Desulfuromonas sp. DDH964 TaxID=1823759 RepID=UPI00078E9700|nr:LEA type 2 family protein [Desulfuromonas sp. DDH964]AMV72322.1 hypothetical protein DBW_1970 [Desulfuromonas sp. DDH964]
MTKVAQKFSCLAACLLVFGCAGLGPGFEEPTVGLSSFRLLPAEGMAPRFEIGLHIVNPNRTPLKLEGIVYSLTLAGQKVVTGATSDLPEVPAYGEGDVTLTATTDLLRSIRLLASLLNQPQSVVTYALDAKLDIGSLRPRIHLQEKGEISLEDGTR